MQRLEFGAHHEKTTVPTILLFPGRGGWQTVVMWKPNWACSTCGMLSSRRYSVLRHIRNLHEGNGIEVSYVDYMEGRLMGIYNPNPYKQQSSSKYNTFFDNFYGATRLNTCSFISSYSNPFMPYSRRSEVYRYPSNYSSSYSDQSYKALKPSSSSSAQPSEDILRQMTTEFSLELARGLAHELLSAARPQPNSQSSLVQRTGGGFGNPILGVQQKEDAIFGYRFKVCEHCLLTEPLEVNFGKDGTNDNNNDNNNAIGRIEQKHLCDPKLVAANKEEVPDKDRSVKAMVNDLPKTATRMTKWWCIKYQKKNCCLIAVKISHKSNLTGKIGDNNNNVNNNIQPQEENIKILNTKNLKQQIIFQYSKEKYIQIDLTSNESSKNHWAARAIKNGHTILTNDEMEDFLKMVQTSTFAIFKIRTQSTAASSSPLQQQKQQHESIGLYLLALVPNDETLYSLSSWVPNKSNTNNNNNNNSAQSKSADETFSSLYNELNNISNFTVPIV